MHVMPAYGWVKALQFSEGGIDATPAQVNNDFADMVAAGAFKKISASFYSPNAPSNPVPGVYYLRHVGFLGAQAPAIKGMRSPSFGDSDEGVVTFSEWDDVTNAALWRNLREHLIGTVGQDKADAVIPGYMVTSLEQGAQDEVREAALEDAASVATASAVPASQFAEPNPKETTVTPEEKTALEAENTRLRAELAQNKADQTHAANLAFCEGLPGVLPAWRGVAVATLDHLAAQATVVEFGEGDARAPLADRFKAMLSALPGAVSFNEHATSARAGVSVDFADAQAISDAATAHQVDAAAKGQDLTHAQAVAVITAKRT